MDTGYTAEFRAFVLEYIPGFEAAAILVCIARDAERDWGVAEVLERLPVTVTRAEAGRFIEMFQARGLLESRPGGRTRLGRSYPLAERVRTLMEAYDHTPVTLVQLCYAMQKEKIRLFSDAFRIRKD